MKVRINHLAAIVAAVVFFVWGAIWFTVLGSVWVGLVNLPPEAMKPSAGPYIASFFLGLIASYTIAAALAQRPAGADVKTGIGFALFTGIGLYATMLLNQYIFESRPFGLWLIDAGYVVIGFVIIGAIIGGWKKRART